MNIYSSLISELHDKTYRDAYVASQIRIGLPFQIRALRKTRSWTQTELGETAGMAQSRVAEIEGGKRSLNLETILRLASAFDVAVEVRFVPFGDLIDHSEAFSPDTFTVPTFEQELQATKKALASIQMRQPYLDHSFHRKVLMFENQKAYQSSTGAVNSLTVTSAIPSAVTQELALGAVDYGRVRTIGSKP